MSKRSEESNANANEQVELSATVKASREITKIIREALQAETPKQDIVTRSYISTELQPWLENPDILEEFIAAMVSAWTGSPKNNEGRVSAAGTFNCEAFNTFTQLYEIPVQIFKKRGPPLMTPILPSRFDFAVRVNQEGSESNKLHLKTGEYREKHAVFFPKLLEMWNEVCARVIFGGIRKNLTPDNPWVQHFLKKFDSFKNRKLDLVTLDDIRNNFRSVLHTSDDGMTLFFPVKYVHALQNSNDATNKKRNLHVAKCTIVDDAKKCLNSDTKTITDGNPWIKEDNLLKVYCEPAFWSYGMGMLNQTFQTTTIQYFSTAAIEKLYPNVFSEDGGVSGGNPFDDETEKKAPMSAESYIDDSIPATVCDPDDD